MDLICDIFLMISWQTLLYTDNTRWDRQVNIFQGGFKPNKNIQYVPSKYLLEYNMTIPATISISGGVRNSNNM